MLGTITLTVGQPDSVTVAQKEEAPEMTVTTQEEVAPQVNGEKVEKESPDANDISAVEETAGEEKADNATEVGFKKIFRFVGFKFTLKKDKGEEKDPVKLLTIKDKDGVEENGTEEPKKEEDTVTAEDKSTDEEKKADTEAATVEAVPEDKPEDVETTDAPAAEKTEEEVKEDDVNKEGEASQDATMTLSPLKKLFSTGLFSNLRKKSSVKKTKEEEGKEAAAEDTTAAAEETPAEVEEQENVTAEETEKATGDVEEQSKEEATTTPEEEKCEPKEEAPASPEEPKPEATAEPKATPETEAPTETTTDEPKQEEEKAEGSAAEEKVTAEVTPEAEIVSSQEKAKPQGSPLKKLFTGAGLKKLSTKKQKAKKDAESKLTESGEQAAEQLQSSSESTEAPKTESGPSSPEDSGEHAIDVEVTQNESSQEAEAEVTSDGEKKKEGIIAWSSFKRLVTPKKLVKRSSDSEDETPSEKPAKSATLSSSESAALTDTKLEEAKEEDSKEEKLPEEEPKTENTEKLVSSTEEPKKKMDTSVSWEALMCMGGTKKRTRKTSDSDDEDTKVEEEAAAPAAGAESAVEEEQETKIEAVVPSENAENEAEVVSAPEPVASPPERESAWDTLKRFVLSKNKPKVEEKPEENAAQSQSDSEAPKEESSFSLRKFLPGRRKKKVEKQASVETGEEDSDTPAVVPLSEYDDQVVAQQEAAAEPAVGQVKVSAEERSPSWIATTIQDAVNQHDQLSDIPEEAENTATPKSVDTDIVEDEILDETTTSPKHLGGLGRRLSTAEVASVALAPDAEATLVPQEPTSHCATEVLQNVEVHVSEISPQTSVTVEKVQVQAASEEIEFEPPTETAESKTNTILQVHAREEAMAICTGLGTKEIAKVAVEKPASPVVEVMAVVRDPLSIDVAIEDKPAIEEQAVVAEDSVFKAQVLQVDTTDLECAVDSSPEGVLDIQAAAEGREPEMEKIGVVTTALEDSVILQSTTAAENSPKVEVINPITPTSETAVCTQSVEVLEPNMETKELTMEEENAGAAIEENTAITEVAQVVTKETSSAICETALATITKETEPNICLVLPSEQVPVIAETVVLSTLAPTMEPEQVKASEEMAIENASLLETVVEKITEVKEIKGEDMSVEVPAVQTPETMIDAVSVQASQIAKEEVQQACESEAQGMAIAQAVIQDAVEKFSKDMPEPKKPSTTTAAIPTAVQAEAKIEKEIEISAEVPVITDTPGTAVCEAPEARSLHIATQVVDTVAIEVTGSLDAPKEEEEKVVEMQTGEESSQVKKEEHEEEEKQVADEKAEEVKEKDEKESETKMPTPVVLQIAQVVEEASVEEEAVVEFDSNVPVDGKTSEEEEQPENANKLSTLSEEPTEVSTSSQVTEATEESQPDTDKTTSKCAEVMAQVIEVIEEAVKEIEPVSTEITATS